MFEKLIYIIFISIYTMYLVEIDAKDAVKRVISF